MGYNPWGHKKPDTSQRLSNNNIGINKSQSCYKALQYDSCSQKWVYPECLMTVWTISHYSSNHWTIFHATEAPSFVWTYFYCWCLACSAQGFSPVLKSPEIESLNMHLRALDRGSQMFSKRRSALAAAATAAKSLQSCLTLCDPIDGSPPGSPIPGILQARILEWVAISFSNAWKWKLKVKSLSRVLLLATPWTAAYQASPSMGFSRQEYWSGVPLPSPSALAKHINSTKYIM